MRLPRTRRHHADPRGVMPINDSAGGMIESHVQRQELSGFWAVSILCSILLRKAGNAGKTKNRKNVRKYNKRAVKLDVSRLKCWSCWADSNCRPHPYQSGRPYFFVIFRCVSYCPKALIYQRFRALFVFSCCLVLCRFFRSFFTKS